MNLLAFDTSTTACSVALQTHGEIKSSHKVAPMQQARLILPMIQELLDPCSISFKDLDAIVYGCGPGSFTGIRIASSVAQGIAFAHNKPVVQISSLAALAQAAFIEHHLTRILIAIDARMEQVYWAIYEVNKLGQMELKGEEQVCAPDKVILPEGENWSGVGDGWQKFEETLVKRLRFQPKAIYPSQLPTAEALLQLAKVKLEQGDQIAANEALPVYLR